MDKVNKSVIHAIQSQGDVGAAAFIADIMSYLTVPEMYVIGGKGETRKFFEKHNLWKRIAQIKYGAEWLKEHENYLLSIEGLIPKGKRINYLWLMAAHWATMYIVPTIELLYFADPEDPSNAIEVSAGENQFHIYPLTGALHITIVMKLGIILKDYNNFRIESETIVVSGTDYSHANIFRTLYSIFLTTRLFLIPGYHDMFKNMEGKQTIREELAF